MRDEQAKILHAIQPFSNEDVLTRTVRGQYGEGIMDNERVPAYRSEEGVPPDSRTETFVAMQAADRQLALGRRAVLSPHRQAPARPQHRDRDPVPARAVCAVPRHAGRKPDAQPAGAAHPARRRHLAAFRRQDSRARMRLGDVTMDFDYADYFGAEPCTGYERLLHDCMIGDATLFQRADMVEAGWSVVNPVLDVWKALPPRNFPNYPAGTWGPKESDELMERDGRRWRNFEK